MKMKKCIKCGSGIAEDSIFCNYCATRQTIKCTRCGADIAGDSIYCNHCGSRQKLNAWVDLGLPSGTLWKLYNESGYFTYDEAVQQFGDNLPSREQFEELKTLCQWEWDRIVERMKVTGPNGNSIVLPAAGYRDCDGYVNRVGSDGNYWSSAPNGSGKAWDLRFNSGYVYLNSFNRGLGCSVRLVQD